MYFISLMSCNFGNLEFSHTCCHCSCNWMNGKNGAHIQTHTILHYNHRQTNIKNHFVQANNEEKKSNSKLTTNFRFHWFNKQFFFSSNHVQYCPFWRNFRLPVFFSCFAIHFVLFILPLVLTKWSHYQASTNSQVICHTTQINHNIHFDKVISPSYRFPSYTQATNTQCQLYEQPAAFIHVPFNNFVWFHFSHK